MVEVAKRTARARAKRDGAVKRRRRWCLALGLGGGGGVWVRGEPDMAAESQLRGWPAASSVLGEADRHPGEPGCVIQWEFFFSL